MKDLSVELLDETVYGLYTFTLSGGAAGERVYVLRTDTERERKQWVAVIEANVREVTEKIVDVVPEVSKQTCSKRS